MRFLTGALRADKVKDMKQRMLAASPTTCLARHQMQHVSFRDIRATLFTVNHCRDYSDNSFSRHILQIISLRTELEAVTEEVDLLQQTEELWQHCHERDAGSCSYLSFFCLSVCRSFCLLLQIWIGGAKPEELVASDRSDAL